jgi:hypothetical protein
MRRAMGNLKKISLLRGNVVLISILLLISYITAVRINGELVRLPTPLFLFFSLFLIKFNVKIIIWILIFSGFSTLHAIMLLLGGVNVVEAEYIARDLALYISLVILYSLFFWSINFDDYEEVIINFFKLYLVISLIFWISSYLTGVYIAVDNSHSIPRAQGLLTEPSNLAHFVPALIIYFWIKSNYKWVLMAGLVILLSFSPTVYITLGCTLLLMALLTINVGKIKCLITLIVILFGLYINWDSVAPHVVSLGQIGKVIARIIEGFIFILEGGAMGANSRASLVFDGIEFMSDKGLWWSGTGFGSSNAVAVKFNDGMLFDANNWSSFVLWFGLPGLGFLLVIHSILLIELRNRALQLKLTFTDYLLTSMIISNTVNGGGVWVQMMFFTLIVYRLLKLNPIHSSNFGLIKK